VLHSISSSYERGYKEESGLAKKDGKYQHRTKTRKQNKRRHGNEF